jgi:hypothetical protein
MPWGSAPEAVVRYALTTLPAFNAFKSVVGQLGGCLRLYVLSGRAAEVLATLEAAKERFEGALSRLHARKVPPLVAHHASLLNAVAAELEAVIARLSKLTSQPLGADTIAVLTGRLKVAREAVLKASDDRFGMLIVNFKHRMLRVRTCTWSDGERSLVN